MYIHAVVYIQFNQNIIFIFISTTICTVSDKRRKKNNERKFHYCRRLRVYTINVLVLVLVLVLCTYIA